MNNNNKKAFTLVELIVVVIIIGIIASIAVPMMSGIIEKAIKTEAITALGTIRTAQREYYVEYGKYATVTNFSAANNQLSGYIPPGTLNGTYFTENCYKTKTVGASDLSSTLTTHDLTSLHDVLDYFGMPALQCRPASSTSTVSQADRVRNLKNIYMLEATGEIIELDGTLIFD